MPEAEPASRPKKRLHPNSLANLIPYKPGENGHGRVYPLKERLRHALDHPLKKPKDDDCAGDHLVYATLKGAIDLIPTPFKETWERTEGKTPDSQPAIAIDNRQVNIYVLNEHTRDLLLKAKERTRTLQPFNSVQGKQDLPE